MDRRPVEGLGSERLRALLAYLAIGRGQECPREHLAALLWPERPDREALNALRYALSNLHSALGDRSSPSPYLLVTRSNVQFDPASDHWVDVAEFERLSSQADVQSLERAASLYRGPFLDGLSLGDSPSFEEWLLLQSEEFRRKMLSLLGRLTSSHMERREFAAAARWARRPLELEPYREQAHRQLMAALALGGERSAALAHYETCRRLLAQELGCEPEDVTQALDAQIRDGSLSSPQLSPAMLSTSGQVRSAGSGQAPSELSVQAAQTSGAQSVRRFVAREQELGRLNALLERAVSGQGGVALIMGEAGSGKTALLDELSLRASQAHRDLIALRGRCNAHGGAGDPYLPFREMLQTLAGDVESKRAGGTLSPEQARRAWAALPAVGAALVEHGPDLIDRFVPGEALLRRAEGFPAPGSAAYPPGILGSRRGRRDCGRSWAARAASPPHRLTSLLR